MAILRNAFSANPAAMVISGTAISVLVFNNEYLKVSSERERREPIPWEQISPRPGESPSHDAPLRPREEKDPVTLMTLHWPGERVFFSIGPWYRRPPPGQWAFPAPLRLSPNQ